MAIEILIDNVPNAATPTVVMGFHDGTFSQAVYLQVDSDPLKCVEMANSIAASFVDACGRAVKAHKEAKDNMVPATLRGPSNG